MFSFEITPEALLIFISAALALLFDYIPALKKWYDTKSEVEKRQIMLGMLLVSGTIVFAGSCLGWFITNLTCTPQDGLNFFIALLYSIGVNQGVHKLTKPAKPKTK